MKALSFLIVCSLCCLENRVHAQTNAAYTIHFSNKVGHEDLIIGNTYTNISGEDITIQKFKYYISNISITDNNGRILSYPEKYFLVDAEDPSSQTLVLPATDVPVKSIRFLLGVDSIRNVSGVQTDALDPLKGMFWTWNSGYVMAKLEGTSSFAEAPGRQFSYHVGGFKTNQNAARFIDMVIPSSMTSARGADISADVNAWFKGAHDISITQTPACHNPGELAMLLADNYSHMFTITSAW